VTHISYIVADATGHIAIPEPVSYTMENGGAPARLLYAEDYPIIAVCKVCGGTIKLDHKLQIEWHHVPAKAAKPVPQGDAK
jgi:hypothetical protein